MHRCCPGWLSNMHLSAQHGHTHTRSHVGTFTRRRLFVHTHTPVRVHTRSHVHMYTWARAFGHAYTGAHLRAYARAHVLMYTHTRACACLTSALFHCCANSAFVAALVAAQSIIIQYLYVCVYVRQRLVMWVCKCTHTRCVTSNTGGCVPVCISYVL